MGSPDQRPPATPAEFCGQSLTALLVMTVLAGAYALHHPFTWITLPGTALAASAATAMAWGADRLYAFVLGPHLAGRCAAIVFGARLPFWFMGGAIGFTVGMLAAKSMDLLIVRDIMVSDLYYTGGYIGVGAEGFCRFIVRPGRTPDNVQTSKG